ncbi:ThiF family adenylyltransferase [Methylocystis echinoides]|jgi:ubiquitin-protein ligase|uniref:ThiF family adenylyltransferase n=1 Tax=Methylocystis echinoides TaxID=29468 RepID=UPI0034315B5C
MWFIRNPDRLKSELEGIETLRDGNAWIGATTNRMLKSLKFGVDFDLAVNGETLPFTLEYPAFFPETPPSVIPRDGRRHSSHQYGAGGELCLEFRSDNWDPSITGAIMIESAYRLLSGEHPTVGERAVVPSAHQETLGQLLRGSGCRFLLTHELKAYAATLPAGTGHLCSIVEIHGPNRTWAAYVAAVGTPSDLTWRENTIPARSDKGEPALLIRVASLMDLPISDQQDLDPLIAATPCDGFVPADENTRTRITVIADAQSARLYYSFRQEGVWRLIPYSTIDLTNATARLPETYGGLASKKVGVVGAGSLGSKIAASLTRSGVGSFVLVDDDILTPGNLVRHELDAGSLGAHKVDGLESRLRAVAPGVNVSGRRVVLGGQESSGTTASVLDELATCDLLVDATADPQAFNFVASVARQFLRPMIWAEVYAGGIGGFVGRLRPENEPPPHAARRQYLAWCRDQGVPWHGEGDRYDAQREDAPPLVADDAEVAVIAAHASRMAVDVLIRPDTSAFPHPGYVIGLSAEWIFAEPFDTRPLDFSPEGEWRIEISGAQVEAAVEYVLSLLDHSVDADRTDT